MAKHLKLGHNAEQQAKQLLLKKGYRFITQNFSTKIGEIDLIFKDNDQLVFVEVKARSSSKHGHPAQAVTPYKLRKISQTGQLFMQQHEDLPQMARIEVVAIDTDTGHFDHLTDIFI